MSLIAIKNHLQSVKVASLNNLSLLFSLDQETLRCMLSHLIRKGKIRLCVRQSACGSRCVKCPVAPTEMYEWVDGLC